MVALAMLFIAEQRAAHNPGLALLSARDIVDMLKETLPRKPQGRDALACEINDRELPPLSPKGRPGMLAGILGFHA